ncbi:O-methyltransferase family 3 protein [Mycena venus]|uniref:O-methyltransferase family 3 protein n=1 Tax=Mycena venus TaxID=2733690 RepID=A0A8H7CT09_9AGAR|nr:O-methyltransferase family 3 protein [Mycena venus]
MSKDYFEEIPPELILLLPPSLSTACLNALASTCHRLHEILQPDLDSRITPKLGQDLLMWAAESKLPHVVAKLLSPPILIHPSPADMWFWSKTPLHAAVNARNLKIARMLLDAGANPATGWDREEHQPLHLAAMNKDLEMMKLLLDYGAPVNDHFGCDWCSQSVLHYACATAHVNMVSLLLERGADLESRGHYGTALGFAVRRGSLEVVKLLLGKGADATVQVPLFTLSSGPPPPHAADLLYIAMGLPHPTSDALRRAIETRQRRAGLTTPRWEGLPLSKGKKELMALLLAHGASKDVAMDKITRNLAALSKEVEYTEEEYLKVIARMLKEAEEAIPKFFK